MAPLCLAQTVKIPQKVLPFPEVKESLQTLDRGLDAVTVSGGQIFTFSEGKRYVVVTPLRKGPASSREERFGKITDSVRKTIYADGKDTPSVRGAMVGGNWLLVMDGALLTLVSIFKEDLQETLRHTTPLDLIKPSADRGGEPPAFEIRDYRAKFKKTFLKAKHAPFVGLAPMPQKWRNTSNELLVLSNLPDFPLLLLECGKENVAQCFLARGCFSTFGKDFAADKVRGLATYSPKRWILVGDPSAKKIRVLKFSSCYQVKEIGTLHLPEKVKTLTGLWIDEQHNLWLATDEPDWFHNASLYMWGESVWTAALN